MTVNMQHMNAMFRDFKVAADVAKMMEMRRFEVEYTMYGSMFLENGANKYIISSQEEKIVTFMNDRANFGKYPLPIISHTLRTTVPSGAEEDITRMVKVNLGKIIRAGYPQEFLEEFRALAFTANDNAAEPILTELQNRMYGLYRTDNLLLFEGLMDLAYRAKHLTEETRASYEAWLEDEWHQMEGDPILEDLFSKEMHGFAYLQNDQIKIYFNAEKPKVYAKKQELEKKNTVISQVFSRVYWYNYDMTLQDVRKAFEEFLTKLFDETYFYYLKQIYDLPPVISAEAMQQLAEKYGSENEQVQQAIAAYKGYWGIHAE